MAPAALAQSRPAPVVPAHAELVAVVVVLVDEIVMNESASA